MERILGCILGEAEETNRLLRQISDMLFSLNEKVETRIAPKEEGCEVILGTDADADAVEEAIKRDATSL